MAAVTTAVTEQRIAGVQKIKKHSLRTDMTPMVDLGFLLITFFVFTAELSKPTVTNLIMPKEGGHTDVGETDAVTILLTKNNAVYYYEGKWEDAVRQNKVYVTSLAYRNGIGDIIRRKQQELDKNPKAREGKLGLMLIIKPGTEASYGNVIDMLDEVLINNVRKYVVTKPEAEEINWLNQDE